MNFIFPSNKANCEILISDIFIVVCMCRDTKCETVALQNIKTITLYFCVLNSRILIYSEFRSYDSWMMNAIFTVYD